MYIAAWRAARTERQAEGRERAAWSEGGAYRKRAEAESGKERMSRRGGRDRRGGRCVPGESCFTRPQYVGTRPQYVGTRPQYVGVPSTLATARPEEEELLARGAPNQHHHVAQVP